MLPEVVQAVNGRAKVVLDGGIMRGTDLVKAKILGADAVGIGRLQGMAYAAAGEDGVVRMLELLEEEARIWQMTLFEKAGLRPEDAELLNSMPLELTSRGPVRVCPRAQTNSGCTSPHCPLAHCRAPDSHITWKFRFWAFDAGHDGWLGEKVGPCAL